MNKLRLLLIVFLSIILSSCTKETPTGEDKPNDYFPDILGQKKYKHSQLFVSNHSTWFYTSGIVTWNFSSRFVRNDTTITVINYSIVDTLYYNNYLTTENGSFEIREDKDHFISFSKIPPLFYARVEKYPRYKNDGSETAQYDAIIFKRNIGLIHVGTSGSGEPPSYNIIDLIE